MEGYGSRGGSSEINGERRRHGRRVNVCDPREKRQVFQSQSRDCAADLLEEAGLVLSESATNRIEYEFVSSTVSVKCPEFNVIILHMQIY